MSQLHSGAWAPLVKALGWPRPPGQASSQERLSLGQVAVSAAPGADEVLSTVSEGAGDLWMDWQAGRAEQKSSGKFVLPWGHRPRPPCGSHRTTPEGPVSTLSAEPEKPLPGALPFPGRAGLLCSRSVGSNALATAVLA